MPNAPENVAARARRTSAALLFLWALASFGVVFFARDLDQIVAGWPLNFWWAAQGGVLVFIGVVVFHAWWMNRAEARAGAAPEPEDG